jgi:hypothetical protein
MDASFGIGTSYAELTGSEYSSSLLAEVIMEPLAGKGMINGGKSAYGYLMSWKDLKAPSALYELQKNGSGHVWQRFLFR